MKIKYKDFEDFLCWEFAKAEPTVLDDDIPDCLSEWLQGLSADEWIEYGDKYNKSLIEENKRLRSAAQLASNYLARLHREFSNYNFTDRHNDAGACLSLVNQLEQALQSEGEQ